MGQLCAAQAGAAVEEEKLRYRLEGNQLLGEIGGLQVGVVLLVGEVRTEDGPHHCLRCLHRNAGSRIWQTKRFVSAIKNSSIQKFQK
jgi:hypothetical protein